MTKLVTIVGARPQFIKAGAVGRAIIRFNESCAAPRKLSHVLVHTGQHYDAKMSQIFFDELQISPPDYNLEVGSDSHGVQTGKLLASIEGALTTEQPDMVIVYGDTNSTLAGALAASKLHLPIAHVEAGLRSFNRRMPEEINRVVADEISNLLFCPTETAVANLKNEGIPSGRPARNGRRDINVQAVHQVGDVMYDSILFYRSLAATKSSVLQALRVAPTEYCLATLHRAENTDDLARLQSILRGLTLVAGSGARIIVPLHPRTQKAIKDHPEWTNVDAESQGRLSFIEPVGYLDMVQLEANAKLILTDSGGVQKEALFLGVPCITLRDETEWIETVSEGWNVLVGASSERILEAFTSAGSWNGKGAPFAVGKASGPAAHIYGDGRSAEQIIRIISEYLT